VVGESGFGQSTIASDCEVLLASRERGVEIWGTVSADDRSDRACRPGDADVLQDPFGNALIARWRVGRYIRGSNGHFWVDELEAMSPEVAALLMSWGCCEDWASSRTKFSGGQRQRDTPSRAALVVKRELHCCDEPTSALDVSV